MQTDNSILIDIRELYSLIESNNFTIEICKLDANDEEENLEFISREYFDNITSAAFYNDSTTQISLIEERPVVTPKNVEYYFTVLTDKQIMQDYSYSTGRNVDDLIDNIEEEIVNC